MNKKPIVCFGEILLRLSPMEKKTILQSTTLEMFVGGAEANVAVALSCLGQPSVMVSAVPDNSIGAYALGELQKFGVDISHINTSHGRLGQYFFESGANYRQAEVIYDREHSVFSKSTIENFNWHEILENASGLHLSGVNLALGEDVIAIVLSAISEAKKLGVQISFDGNFRPALWQGREDRAKEVLNEILIDVDVAFLTEQDIALITGESFQGTEQLKVREKVCKLAFKKYPNLKKICSTYKQKQANGNLLFQGLIYLEDKVITSNEYLISSIIDPIGTGDAFAAGILRSLNNKDSSDYSVEFATALAVTKHSIPGDFAIRNFQQVENVMNGEWTIIKR